MSDQHKGRLGSLPSLNALRAFVAVSRHLSLNKAAEDLGVTPAAVAQQMKSLEEQMGCTLIHRTGRDLHLTETGLGFSASLSDAFDRISSACQAIPRASSSRRLTVSAAPSFAAKWLIPRLENFQRHYPDIDVLVNSSMRLIEFEKENMDCAIRYGAGYYPGLSVDLLMTESVIVVASPELLKHSGPVLSPSDLQGMSLLHDDSPDQDASCPDWRMWLAAAGAGDVNCERGPRFNQSALVLEAACAGRGVALAKAQLARSDILSGRLVQLFSTSHPVKFAYYFVRPLHRPAVSFVAEFQAWLISEAQSPDSI